MSNPKMPLEDFKSLCQRDDWIRVYVYDRIKPTYFRDERGSYLGFYMKCISQLVYFGEIIQITYMVPHKQYLSCIRRDPIIDSDLFEIDNHPLHKSYFCKIDGLTIINGKGGEVKYEELNTYLHENLGVEFMHIPLTKSDLSVKNEEFLDEVKTILKL